MIIIKKRASSVHIKGLYFGIKTDYFVWRI